jgi:DNA-binding MarR family transcriptional regulator
MTGTSRMTRVASRELNARIVTLAMQGKKSREIADVLGITVMTAQMRVSRLVQSGTIPRRANRQDRIHKDDLLRLKYGKRLGTMHQLVSALTEGELHQIGREAPEGMTVAQYIAAILCDALA